MVLCLAERLDKKRVGTMVFLTAVRMAGSSVASLAGVMVAT
jgi:hypothetical protein